MCKGFSLGPSGAHGEQEAVTVTGLTGEALLFCGQILEQKACLCLSVFLHLERIHTGTTYILYKPVCNSTLKTTYGRLTSYVPLQDDRGSPPSSLPEGQEAWHGASIPRVSLGSASSVLHCMGLSPLIWLPVEKKLVLVAMPEVDSSPDPEV